MTASVKSITNKLLPLFIKLPIDVVYLYGSRSFGNNDSLSDYDFGVLFDDKLLPSKRFDLQLKLFSDIADRLKVESDMIDVVDLKNAPVLLCFNILSGKIIYSKNNLRRITFETYVIGKYHDERYYYDRYLKETLSKIRKGVYFERNILYS